MNTEKQEGALSSDNTADVSKVVLWLFMTLHFLVNLYL